MFSLVVYAADYIYKHSRYSSQSLDRLLTRHQQGLCVKALVRDTSRFHKSVSEVCGHSLPPVTR
jgi:hypothetical protein